MKYDFNSIINAERKRIYTISSPEQFRLETSYLICRSAVHKHYKYRMTFVILIVVLSIVQFSIAGWMPAVIDMATQKFIAILQNSSFWVWILLNSLTTALLLCYYQLRWR